MNPVSAPQWLLSRGQQCVAPEAVSQRMCIAFTSTIQIKQNSLWLRNSEDTTPEIQNSGTTGPKIGHVNVSDKKCEFTVVGHVA